MTRTHVPNGTEGQTGKRAPWTRNIMRLSSAANPAWLDWAARCPVVMISGFTHPNNEFATPGRVMNWHVCNSCWNDVRHLFDHNDFLWCPRHKDTGRAFECSRSITINQVKAALYAVGLLPINERP